MHQEHHHRQSAVDGEAGEHVPATEEVSGK